jgi:hypothetical protein
MSVHRLKALQSEKLQAGKQRCILLYFNESDYTTYENAILAHGGKKKGGNAKGLIGQEQALLKLIAKTH